MKNILGTDLGSFTSCLPFAIPSSSCLVVVMVEVVSLTRCVDHFVVA